MVWSRSTRLLRTSRRHSRKWGRDDQRVAARDAAGGAWHRDSSLCPACLAEMPVAPVATLDWHYQGAGHGVGPVPEDTIRQMILGGSLLPGSCVWNETMSEWKPLDAASLSAYPPEPSISAPANADAPASTQTSPPHPISLPSSCPESSSPRNQHRTGKWMAGKCVREPLNRSKRCPRPRGASGIQNKIRINLKAAMRGRELAQRRKDAKGRAADRTHPLGEWVIFAIYFFFAALRDIPSPFLGLRLGHHHRILTPGRFAARREDACRPRSLGGYVVWLAMGL